MHTSRSFNTIDYRFTWTSDWYKWEGAEAKKDAMRARNAEAKRLRAEGWTVKVGSNAALMSRGGIGSGHPHIELWSTVYTISATKD